METLNVKGTKSTPNIMFNTNKGLLFITGRSFPEMPETVYKPLFDRLNKVKTNNLVITIELEYINTSSTKMLLNLLKEAENKIKEVSIIWTSEEDDEDMIELGEYFASMLKAPFEFKEYFETMLEKSY